MKTIKLIFIFLMFMVIFKTIHASELRMNQWYSCISPDQKGEIFIKRIAPAHIVGDDIDLWYSKKENLYIGYNGFNEKVIIGLIPKQETIIFGTSTIEPEEWKCEKIYGKIPNH